MMTKTRKSTSKLCSVTTSSKMEKLYLSSCIILIMITGWLEADLCGIQKRFEKVVENGRSGFSNASVISNHRVTVEGECFFTCLKEPSCMAFKFKPNSMDEVNCMLSNLTINNGEDLEKGWIYYHEIGCSNQTKYKKNKKCTYGTPQGLKKRNVTCTVLKVKYPGLETGVYNIVPQGVRSSPFPVYCDMTSKNEIGVTVIGHNSESRTKVNGYEYWGSYKRDIVFDATMEQIVAVMSQSRYCEQFIKYECSGSQLLQGRNGWWVSRQGNKMNYWGGAAVDSGMCACAMTSSCVEGKNCNCDANDANLREDSGYLTDKSTLPVKQLRFGDTGGSGEYGYHTLGKLLCWG